ncbi:PAS domain-containing protein [Rapidithrix thailandica]|uniref:histidine kinase n=1 Tax=Rapidithrix thailandica TaxID=413964 RepID=A0AAW9SDA4_9BACT
MVIAEEIETRRINELRKYNSDPIFHRKELTDLTQLIAQICEAPMAAITVVEEEELQIKTAVGFDERSAPRKVAFCHYTIQEDEPMVVEDTEDDYRFCHTPIFLKHQQVRFYAGMPLISPNGLALGTLCVFDTVPRRLNQQQLFALKTLAKQVMHEMELSVKNKNLIRSNRQLLKEKELLRQSQYLAKIGSFECNVQDKTWSGSSNFLRIFGFHKEKQYSWEDFRAIIHPEDRAKVDLSLSNMQHSKNHLELNYRCINLQTKAVLHVHSICRVIKNLNNQVVKIFGIKQDITEKVLSEKALAKSEKRLATLINNLPGMVFQCKNDEDWSLMYCSEGSHDLFHCSPEALKKCRPTMAKRIPKGYQEKVKQAIRQAQKHNNHYEVTYPIKVNQGFKWIWERGKVVGKDSNNIELLEGFMTDITSQIQTQVALKESEARWQFALESSGDGIWDWDLPQNKMFYSPQWKAILGYGSHEVAESMEEWKKRIHPEDYTRCISKFQRHLLQKTDMFQHEYRMKTREGKYKWVLTRGKVIKFSSLGKPLRVIGTQTDISDKVATEKRLKKQNSELTKANQELDNFVYRVSHDLRAPIASVTGIIELLKQDNTLSEASVNLLDLAKTSLNKQDHFIKDILDYSRNSRLEIQKNAIDFKSLVAEVFSHYEYNPEYEKAEISYQIEQAAPFLSDKRRLEVILHNLVSNALRYAKPYFHNAKIQVEVIANAREATIRVTDNGIGIAPEHLPNIFKMFYRATDHKPGSGLGLYIAKESIQKIYGKIQVASTLDKGSSFTLKLPNLLQR